MADSLPWNGQTYDASKVAFADHMYQVSGPSLLLG